MARFTILALVSAAAFSMFAASAPLDTRQVGSVQCNINRLQVVTGLAKSKKTLSALASADGQDAALASAVTTATAGVTAAQNGVKNIGKAIATGQNAGAADRDAVGTGLQQAITAINGVQSSGDAQVDAEVAKVKKQLAKTLAAGGRVVQTCK